MFVTKKKYDKLVNENKKLKESLDWALWCLKRLDIESSCGHISRQRFEIYLDGVCRYVEEMNTIHNEVVSKTTKEP